VHSSVLPRRMALAWIVPPPTLQTTTDLSLA